VGEFSVKKSSQLASFCCFFSLSAVLGGFIGPVFDRIGTKIWRIWSWRTKRPMEFGAGAGKKKHGMYHLVMTNIAMENDP